MPKPVNKLGGNSQLRSIWHSVSCYGQWQRPSSGQGVRGVTGSPAGIMGQWQTWAGRGIVAGTVALTVPWVLAMVAPGWGDPGVMAGADEFTQPAAPASTAMNAKESRRRKIRSWRTDIIM